MATEIAQLAGRLELDVPSDGRPANPVVVLPLDRWRDAPSSLIDRAAGLVAAHCRSPWACPRDHPAPA